MRVRADQADRAERAVRDPVGRADEREVVESRVRELVADPDERPARVERLGEHVEQRAAALEQVDQRAVRAELLVAHLVEQAGGAADVDPLLRRRAASVNDGRKHREELALARRGGWDPRAGGGAGRCRARGRRAARSGTAPPSARARRRPGASNAYTRLVTPPVEVITTTITIWGWSISTSTWRTVAAWSGGAETSAISRVTCESISVVA